MLKRGVILGSLVAGAFLLPGVVGAAVTGVCSQCHTMHASQNGTTTTPQNTLLKAGGCNGCHLVAGVENLATGHANDTIGAPQVDGTAATGFVLNGGYFDVATNDNTHHNVADIPGEAADTNFVAAGSTRAPGNAAGVGTLIDAGGNVPALTCVSCHGASGGHHGAASAGYRLLNPAMTMKVNPEVPATKDWGAVAASATVAVGTRSAGTRVYDATSVNQFCASCHNLFHNGAGYGANETAAGSNIWLRHPTGNRVITTAGGSILQNRTAAGDNDQVVIGGDATADNVVMCLSCHVPHGGPNADLLSYPMNASTNFAGDGTASNGCEFCHSYGVVGTETGM